MRKIAVAIKAFLIIMLVLLFSHVGRDREPEPLKSEQVLQFHWTNNIP